MTPLNARTALDTFFLEARSKLLDLAAIFDRIDRGSGRADLDDPRLQRLRQALELIREEKPGRAERVQQLFSLEYDPNWERPQPRF
jgi:hypothetical protein